MPDQHETPHTSSSHPSTEGNATSAETRGIRYYLDHLMRFGENICGTGGAAEHFCRELARVTANCVQLSLSKPGYSPPTSSFPASLPVTFPVKLHNGNLATLYFFDDPEASSLQLSLDDVKCLAAICGVILSVFEQTAYIKKRLEGISLPDPDSLSKREKEVLTLMGHRYDEEAIARALRVASGTVRKHRQHIYAKLGVRCEQDALLIAYQLQIFSPLDDISSTYGLHLVR